MHLNKFKILIILVYQFALSTCTQGKNKTGVFPHCRVYMSPRNFTWPIPFRHGNKSSIMLPNISGHVFFKKGQKYQLSCTSREFKLLRTNHEREITVECVQNDYFLYNGSIIRYRRFQCEDIPESRLIITSHKCQGNHSVGAVGFQVKKRFFILYNICFDLQKKTPIYSWYFADSPYKTNRQPFPKNITIIKTRQFFGDIDIRALYRKQGHMLIKTLASVTEMRKYFKPYNASLLYRNYLTSRTEFYYGFQQEATFYFENSVPIWKTFYTRIWKHVESYLGIRLIQGVARHLVISGTYGVCELPDVNNTLKPIYLDYPNRVPVPKFIWKLDFDTTGFHRPIVYIGMNYPFYRYDKDAYICKPTPCASIIQNILFEASKTGLVYCCTKNAFENVYGRLDSILFHRNLL